jgi:copper chaperone CopZ
MRTLTILAASLFLFGQGAAQAFADSVEVKGPHICCGQCVKVAVGLLKDIDGVSEAKADAKSKTVTFTAKDEKAAKAGVQALVDGGFFGKATCEGKDMKITAPAGEGKADEVAVTKVHVCCGQCQTAIKGLFKDAKISFEEKGPQRTVRIQGTDLDRDVVLQTLRKAGFNGTLAK